MGGLGQRGTAFLGMGITLTNLKLYDMLRWSFIFLIVAIVAAIFGFTDIASGAAAIAKVLFFIFLVVWLLMIILGVTIFKKS